jgi:2-polyprenyl-3-methyl-5-hydroxy-6-metoxy-1,4-benzoquinol methylase
MNLTRRDTDLTELMDDPECDAVRLRRTLQRFETVNRLVSGWNRVYDSYIRAVLASSPGPMRILDIGCGSGDVLRGLVRRARRDGFEVTGVGIDPDHRSLAVAKNARTMPGVAYRQAFSKDLVRDGESYDIVISNHLLHHLSAEQFHELIADSESLSSRLCVHSDIARGRVAYAAYAVGITPLAPGTFLRTDGLRSIRRSYTRDELLGRLPRGWTAERSSVFRVLALHRAPGVAR